MWTYYGWDFRFCRLSVNTICGRIMVGFVVVVIGQYTKHDVVIRLDLSLLSSVRKHNAWSYRYYGWVCLRCHLSVTENMWTYVDLSLLSSVSKHNMWSYYGWFCPPFHLSVNTIYDRNKVGFVVVVVRQ